MSLTEDVTKIDLLRHGACEGGEIYRGRTDVVLSDVGWQQMEEAVAGKGPWSTVITSPLLRCRLFAEQCAENLGVALEVVDGLREMDFGDWEGRPLKEVWQEDPKLVSRFYSNPEAVTPPGGEPTADALQRVVEAWLAILKVHAGENLLLICHGGVIRLLASHLLEMPLSAIARLNVPYASTSRVEVYHRDGEHFPMLHSLNAGGASA